jgi:tripartite-type tricarboxylate transporter receptor subunit TctC
MSIRPFNPSFPAKTVHAFIAYAKANPGKLNMASASNGALGHVELFKRFKLGEVPRHLPPPHPSAIRIDTS